MLHCSLLLELTYIFSMSFALFPGWAPNFLKFLNYDVKKKLCVFTQHLIDITIINLFRVHYWFNNSWLQENITQSAWWCTLPGPSSCESHFSSPVYRHVFVMLPTYNNALWCQDVPLPSSPSKHILLGDIREVGCCSNVWHLFKQLGKLASLP